MCRIYLRIGFFGAAIFALLALNACSLILTNPHEPALEHTVEYKGETMSIVSLWYTGTAKNAKRIRRFNDLASSKLQPGQEIYIPRRLLVRSAPLTKAFVLASYTKKDIEVAASKISPKIEIPVEKKESPIDLVDASPSSIVNGRQAVSEGIVEQSKPNDWIREELERDSMQETMIRNHK